jgi:hypothetical protein
MTSIGKRTSAPLWAPLNVVTWVDRFAPETSADVEANKSAFDVQLVTTDRHYPVNHIPIAFGGMHNDLAVWGAYAHGVKPPSWVWENLPTNWPCQVVSNCRVAGKVQIEGSLSGVLWKNNRGPSDLIWTLGTWRIRCNAYPGPTTEGALRFARLLLALIRKYPLPKVAGRLSIWEAADGSPTTATWQDGTSTVYARSLSPEIAVPLLSSMRKYRGN